MFDRFLALAEASYVAPFNKAAIHVGSGELKEAFAGLEKAFEERLRSMAWLNLARKYGRVPTDPRFKPLVRQAGLPEEAVLM